MSLPRLLLMMMMAVTVTGVSLGAAEKAKAPLVRPSGIDPATWERLLAVDAKVQNIGDLQASFRQEKFTPLLKKPLVSTGRVLLKARHTRWDTAEPRQSTVYLTQRELTVYFPQENTAEVYPLSRQLGHMAASPVPRLGALLDHFEIHRPTTGGDGGAGALRLRLVPRAAELREHLEHLDVELDEGRGILTRIEMADAADERTVIVFEGVEVNTGLDDAAVALTLPDGVRVHRPLGEGGR